MKKIIFLLFLALVVLEAKSQGPIMPYSENGYSISETKKFALSNSALANSWREEFLKIINVGLVAGGENLTLDQRHIAWALDQVQYELVSLEPGHINSRRSVDGLSVEFFTDKKSFTGMVGVFKYNNVRAIVFKTVCMNLLKIKIQSKQQVEPKSTTYNNISSIDTVYRKVVVIDDTIYQNNKKEQQCSQGYSSGYSMIVGSGVTFTPSYNYGYQQPQIQQVYYHQPQPQFFYGGGGRQPRPVSYGGPVGVGGHGGGGPSGVGGHGGPSGTGGHGGGPGGSSGHGGPAGTGGHGGPGGSRGHR